MIFTCITYHHLEDRVSYFKNASKYLRPGGRITVIDFNGEGWFTRLIGHWTPREVILQELQQADYSLQQELTFLPNQVFLLFSYRGR